MNTQYTIREYKPVDADALIAIWEKANAAAHPFLPEAYVRTVAADLRTLYLPNAEVWVLADDDQPIGFIAMMGAEIGGLFLHPDHHGAGLGRKLTDHAFALKGPLKVEVFRENAIGRRFYERYGFAVDREYRHDPSGRDVLIMKMPDARRVTILATVAKDMPGLQDILVATDLFPSAMLPPLIAPYLGGDAPEQVWLTAHGEDGPVGFCYAEQEALTAGTWNLRAIAVAPIHQNTGVGGTIVRYLEAVLRTQGQRLLIVDTSGTAPYSGARRFYRRNGYREEARIREFWGPGDDKVTFAKSL